MAQSARPNWNGHPDDVPGVRVAKVGFQVVSVVHHMLDRETGRESRRLGSEMANRLDIVQVHGEPTVKCSK